MTWFDLIQIISFEVSQCQWIVYASFVPVVFVEFDWTGDNDNGTCVGGGGCCDVLLGDDVGPDKNQE